MGGESTRMGRDKSQLKYEGTTLAQRAYDLLLPHCNQVYYSISEAQLEKLDFNSWSLDLFENQGPLGGIISSLSHLEESILTVAVDMPKLTSTQISRLIGNRDEQKLATVFFNEKNQMFEGTVGIWEYHGLDELYSYFDSGKRSLQKFLFNHDIKRVMVEDYECFRNINTNDDYKNLI